MPYSEAYAGVFAAPDYISHAERDDWQIVRKSQYTALIRLLIRNH